MQKLNLPSYNFKIRKNNENQEIFDFIRKQYVSLSPEEWVRQNFIRFLVEEKNYPQMLIAVEKSIKLNRMIRRPDIVIYNKNIKAKLIVECKAPAIKITQTTLDQIVRYNMVLKVDYLVVSNGLVHYCVQVNYKANKYNFINEVPDFSQLQSEEP
ncbi:MAG: type I restriction enzyme HsdR N-terminal domain-containing protein [Bacteroidales bacterium]|nr:type I restriction enzyme HsdR N-terminal domain-containing protein [Bacteroidales bacterium]